MSPARHFAVISGGAEGTSVAEVGGKGHSLMRMAEAGLPVPPGLVLTTHFFAPWLEVVLASSLWTAFIGADPARWGPLCEGLKRLCSTLEPTASQRETLEEVRRRLAGLGETAFFAVRSSSPEEDLASASFAGGYETELGARPSELEEALRHCFASTFDERVLVYKRERGFDVLSPRIAVVVQQQIRSEVAGVAFSLNPLTNDYDEAVIDANWGLGESVVAGSASPDHYVVDKSSGELVERRLGAKQISIWLAEDGGTVIRREYRATEQTLRKDQLGELTDLLRRIEELHGTPTDIEWAYAGEKLHVLQARPITTYVPLPPEMETRPGERRRLYGDAALSQGLTINEPISPLGLAWMQEMLYARMLRTFGGIDDFTPAGGLIFAAGSRLYMNLSNTMWLGMTPKMMAKSSAATDALLAEILASVDPQRYRAAKRPSWLRLRLLLFVPRIVWALRRVFWQAPQILLVPVRARHAYQRHVDAFETELTQNLDDHLPLGEFATTCTNRLGRELPMTLLGVFAGLVSPGFLIPRRSPEARSLSEKLKRGMTGNIVVEQGLALFRLARRLRRHDFDDIPGLAERIEERRMPDEFLREWDAFVQRFGCRGPHEMDLASPRYADDPTLALRQMSFMAAGDDSGFDPEAVHRRNVDERHRAAEELLRRSGWLRRALLRRVFLLIELFGGVRDTPKHQTVLVSHAIRKRALIEGRRLVKDGRLDAAEDVFGLTFRDLEAAQRDPELDLRAVRAERTAFARLLTGRVSQFPQVIDSRGRILRPPRRATKPGELVGMAVSPGSVKGPVKVLHHPRDKAIEEGDVLVAYTTDPGWTPLFVNAGAVVLEVGGVLQHGAVIAREYGKPCVAGVDRVVSTLRDGQWVEVDGTVGIIRLLEREHRHRERSGVAAARRPRLD